MSERENRKRKSKSWYRKQAFKQRKTDGKPGHRLIAGLRGFIITCNDRERDAVKESYNILNEYADKLYGPERKEEAGSDGESDEEDIEAAIAKEVQSLKEAATSGERRFQNSQTGAKNCIFIKTTLNDPVALAHAIFTDLRETKQQKSRHALRLLPVVGTCKANVKDISDLAKVVLQPFFTDTQFEVTFSINFKARNNNGVGREMTITTLRDTIMETFPSVLLRFTHTNPQITILVEVMCGVACIAVAKDFAHFRKYNLLEVIRDKPTEENSSVKSEDTSVQPVPSTEDNSKVKSEDTSVQPVLFTEDNSKVKSEDTSVQPVLSTEANSKIKSEDTPVQPVLSTEDNSSVQSKDASVKNFPSTEENSDVQREHASMEQTADNQDAAVLEGEHQEGSAMGSVSEQSYSSCKDSESVSVKDTDREDSESVSVKDTDKEDSGSVPAKDAAK